MVKLSDDTPEAAVIMEAQARRLEHLRRAMGLTRTQAAEMAGVSRFTWRRMEEGKARIDTVPLSRFLAAYPRHPDLPGEYVLSGSTVGLPRRLIENLEELDRTEPGHSTQPSAGSGNSPSIAISGKSKPRGNRGSGTSRPLEDEQEAA